MLSSICAMRRCHLGSSEVLVAIVHRLELTAIDGHDRLREQIQSAAQHDKLATHVADRWPVVLAEVGNGLEVRHQTSSQPHELDVALRLALQTTARLNAIEITVGCKSSTAPRGGTKDGPLPPNRYLQIRALQDRVGQQKPLPHGPGCPRRCSHPGTQAAT